MRSEARWSLRFSVHSDSIQQLSIDLGEVFQASGVLRPVWLNPRDLSGYWIEMAENDCGKPPRPASSENDPAPRIPLNDAEGGLRAPPIVRG